MNNLHHRVRMDPLDRRKAILDSAINLALKNGCLSLTRNNVAVSAGCAHGLVTYYFQTMNNLKNEILQEAIRRELIPIVAENLSNIDKKLNADLKQKVIDYLKI